MARRINLDKYGAGIFKRTEMYAAQVSKQFESAVERLLKLSRSVELGEGELFTFSYNNRMGREANAILRDLYANVYQQIKNGATMEWEYANMSADAMIRSIFGKVADDNHFARYFLRNQEAMDAFFERRTAGLNLSQRVWNCTGQLKDEMELALSVAMGKGESASTISRQVRQYLQEPDKLFRRVRDEQGNLKLSKAAAAYHPGQGVYRSSYKNAMRLTRTETNMAYRSADHERWQRLNFVIGIEIQTSGNHPDADICDELAGVHPKDFKFVGWHPQCRCFATPLLADEQDMMDWSEKVMRGEAGINDFKAQQITEMPENFTKWLEANADRIENATHKPYFLTDNEALINGTTPAIADQNREPTPQEIAERRHAERTPEYEQSIRDARAAELEEMRQIRKKAEWELDDAEFMGFDVSRLKKALEFGEMNAVQRELDALRAVIEDTRSGIGAVVNDAQMLSIEAKKIKMLKDIPTSDDVIRHLCGGDLTEGSCSSQALAYIGRRGGLDVTDFRGGRSREFFASEGHLEGIARGAGGVIERGTNYFETSKNLLGQVEEGKEYFFGSSKHAAVVRRVGGELQYLELQSPTIAENGWQTLTDRRLQIRFCAWDRALEDEADSVLIEASKLQGNAKFKDLLEYLNTSPGKQMKGAAGAMK